jgi:hypothetical protein
MMMGGCPVDRLEAFLTVHAPANTLMPAKGKTPAAVHRFGSWSWDRWRSLRRLQSSSSSNSSDGSSSDGSGSDGSSSGGDKGSVGKSWTGDVCLLLQDLCVIDVDCRDAEARLEASFGPMLACAPKERTARGAHYWFRRSALCDSDGYYNARSEIIPGVDLKTRCRTGTSGILVVAPSTNKTWVTDREPWSDGIRLDPIPDELLMAVARPRHRRLKDVPFRFEDGEEARLTVSEGLMETLAYFEPFLTGDLKMHSSSPTPVPCTREEFENVVRIFECDCESIDDLEGLRLALKACAKLGATQKDLAAEGILDRVIMHADVLKHFPEANPRLARTPVDPIHVAPIVCDPPPTSIEMYRMWDGVSASRLPQTAVDDGLRGKVMVDEDLYDRCKQRIPIPVLELMKRFPLALAGGNALYSVSSPRSGIPPGSDWDLYLYGICGSCEDNVADSILADNVADSILADNVADSILADNVTDSILADNVADSILADNVADSILEDIDADSILADNVADSILEDIDAYITGLSSPEGRVYAAPPRRSRNAITYVLSGGPGAADSIIVQVVLQLFEEPSDIVRRFDLAPCKIVVWFDKRDDDEVVEMQIRVTHDWIESIRRMSIVLHRDAWNLMTLHRAVKYSHKGFRVYLPGVRSSALVAARPSPSTTVVRHRRSVINGYFAYRVCMSNAYINERCARRSCASSNMDVSDLLPRLLHVEAALGFKAPATTASLVASHKTISKFTRGYTPMAYDDACKITGKSYLYALLQKCEIVCRGVWYAAAATLLSSSAPAETEAKAAAKEAAAPQIAWRRGGRLSHPVDVFPLRSHMNVTSYYEQIGAGLLDMDLFASPMPPAPRAR